MNYSLSTLDFMKFCNKLDFFIFSDIRKDLESDEWKKYDKFYIAAVVSDFVGLKQFSVQIKCTILMDNFRKYTLSLSLSFCNSTTTIFSQFFEFVNNSDLVSLYPHEKFF